MKSEIRTMSLGIFFLEMAKYYVNSRVTTNGMSTIGN